MVCLECKKAFTAIRKNQRFCSTKCKNVYHGKEKARGIRLTPTLHVALESLANAHGVPINEMACIIIHQVLQPDGQPLTDEEIYGRENAEEKDIDRIE